MNLIIYMKGYQYNIIDELLIDNFAGGGGASTGIELATGRIVDIAINHDCAAIEMHQRNHLFTKHYLEDVWQIDPRKITQGRPVALVWCSPDCKHFSKAKGGTPVSKHIRGLAWIAVRWAATVKPRVIILENVEEFQTWGPVKDGKPIKEQAGRTFHSFVNALKYQGYQVDWRVLRACDYGAPTSRKRFFLVARCDGKPIVFPSPTHGKGKGLKPYHTAVECIDFSLPCKSIFNRKKPLVENTLQRIARGIVKFVLKSPRPYIVSNNTNNAPHDIFDPVPTITTGNRNYLITPYLTKYFSGESQAGADVREPFPTITAIDHNAVVLPYLTKYYSGKEQARNRNQSLDFKTYLTKLTGNKQNLGEWPKVRELLNRFSGYNIAEDEILILAVDGKEYFISDIGMRMLTPKELATAQGFPPDYVLQVTDSYSTKAQIARIGNSVCPIMAEQLVRANLPEMCGRKIRTMKQLEKILIA